MGSDIWGIDAYEENKNKLDDKYACVVSNIPEELIFDKKE